MVVSGDKDVGTLANLCQNQYLINVMTTTTYTESDYVGLVWLDWYEVVGDHSHSMVVDGEALYALGTSIDESQTVSLPGRELEDGNTSVRRALLPVGDQTAIEIHFAIDQIIVGGWRWGWW